MKVLLTTIIAVFMRLLLANWCHLIKCTAEVVTQQQQHNLKIAVLLPIYDQKNPRVSMFKWPYFAQMLLPGFDVAIEKVNSTLLPFHNITRIMKNTYCALSSTQIEMLDLQYEQDVDVFFGPVCEYTTAGTTRFCMHWNKPLLTPGALAYGMSDKSHEFRTLTRLQGSYDKFGRTALVNFFEQNSWNRTAFFYQNSGIDEINDYHFSCGGSYFMLVERIERVYDIEFTMASLNAQITEYLLQLQRVTRSKYVIFLFRICVFLVHFKLWILKYKLTFTSTS